MCVNQMHGQSQTQVCPDYRSDTCHPYRTHRCPHNFSSMLAKAKPRLAPSPPLPPCWKPACPACPSLLGWGPICSQDQLPAQHRAGCPCSSMLPVPPPPLPATSASGLSQMGLALVGRPVVGGETGPGQQGWGPEGEAMQAGPHRKGHSAQNSLP